MPVLTAIFLLVFFSVSGKQQLHLVHDQGQKSKQKDTMKILLCQIS